MTTTTSAWGTTAADAPLERMTIERRDVGATDIAIDLLYCGICHSDVHTARNEWGGTRYPAVPGHEMVGRVGAVGPDVSRFAVGDMVAVGCMVDSCGECSACRDGLQNYCENGATFTYNSVDKHGTAPRTYGGYSASIVVTEGFVLRVPPALDPAAAAPILCAGITMYSPLRHHGVGPGSTLAVAGFGGLGSIAVKLATAMGADVTVLTRTDRKAEDAFKAGAAAVLVMSDPAAVRAAARSFDLILSTIPVSHDVNPYLNLLRRDGGYVLLGALEPLREPISGGAIAGRRLTVTGSMIGGIPETQEVLDFCAEHAIAPDIALIGADRINDAYDQLAAGDPGYRYVIDLSTL
jgi:uncharacterized zinc-type alcohol dehydrogenase-like protein